MTDHPYAQIVAVLDQYITHLNRFSFLMTRLSDEHRKLAELYKDTAILDEISFAEFTRRTSAALDAIADLLTEYQECGHSLAEDILALGEIFGTLPNP